MMDIATIQFVAQYGFGGIALIVLWDGNVKIANALDRLTWAVSSCPKKASKS